MLLVLPKFVLLDFGTAVTLDYVAEPPPDAKEPVYLGGAILPGIMMAVLYLVYALGRCWLNPKLGPPLRDDQIPDDRSHVWREFALGLVPPTILIAFAMGSILFGWATPTEGADPSLGSRRAVCE